jgi:hypothetical protein
MNKMKLDMKPTREGDVLLLMVPNYWGRGATVGEAKKNLRLAGGGMYKYFRLLSVHPSTEVDVVDGGLSYPKGHRPEVVAESLPKERKA